jgi:predicted nucleic acid-binding protein
LIAIINASPLIFLSKIGCLNHLTSLFDEIITTPIVKDEVLIPKTSPEVPILKNAFDKWLHLASPSDENMVMQLMKSEIIHKGEASIIVLGKEYLDQGVNSVVIIDDLAARKIAKTFGLKITGSIGIILRLVKERHLTNTQGKIMIQKLIEETDFHISIKLYLEIIKELNEIA